MSEAKSQSSGLMSELFKQVECGLFCDFTIIVGNEKIKVHKSVLAATSTVFKEMLESCGKTENDYITIHEYDHGVVMQMVEYIYKAKASKMKDVAAELLHLAEKFNLTNLKGKCQKVLVDQLCVDNVIARIQLANRYNAELLKTKALEFMYIHFDDIRVRPEWEESEDINIVRQVANAFGSFSPPPAKKMRLLKNSSNTQ